MRILIKPGDHTMTNLGDVAMTQVAVTRLTRLWPDARIDVITERDDLLKTHCPGTFPVPVDGQVRWLHQGTAFGGQLYKRVVPSWLASAAGRVEARLRSRWPRLAYRGIRFGARLRPEATRKMTAFFEALSGADLVVVSGSGDITSTFEPYALSLMALLRLSRILGARTALFGQGVGPIQSPALWNEAKAVLPQADLITLREKRTGVGLLADLGVERTRVTVTGDDAVELAYTARGESHGGGIGVNLRYASYAAVGRSHIDRVRPVLHEAAARYSAPLIPVPVRLAGDNSDPQTGRMLLEGYGSDQIIEGVATPQQVINLVGRCRVVVTGSYHAAVFALAQGIPAVGLASSQYYVNKFLGLDDMFGGGCELVRLDDPELPERLRTAIDRAWHAADDIRPILLNAAATQVAAGNAAYVRCYDLVQDGKRPRRAVRSNTAQDSLVHVRGD